MTRYYMTDTGHVYMTNPIVSLRQDCHPVAVIDPEDREQVERLAIAYTLRHNYAGKPWGEREQHNRDLVIDSLADALRELADPTPPKPEEPTGLGAVVEDAEGVPWVRNAATYSGYAWRSGARPDDFMTWRHYADLNVVRVLSEGVTP